MSSSSSSSWTSSSSSEGLDFFAGLFGSSSPSDSWTRLRERVDDGAAGFEDVLPEREGLGFGATSGSSSSLMAWVEGRLRLIVDAGLAGGAGVGSTDWLERVERRGGIVSNEDDEECGSRQRARHRARLEREVSRVGHAIAFIPTMDKRAAPFWRRGCSSVLPNNHDQALDKTQQWKTVRPQHHRRRR